MYEKIRGGEQKQRKQVQEQLQEREEAQEQGPFEPASGQEISDEFIACCVKHN